LGRLCLKKRRYCDEIGLGECIGFAPLSNEVAKGQAYGRAITQ